MSRHLSIYFGKVPDISGVVLQDNVDRFRLTLMGFDNGFIGEVNTEVEEYITQRLIESLLKSRLDRPPNYLKTE